MLLQTPEHWLNLRAAFNEGVVMPLRSLSDINRAFDEGRWHLSRVIKSAGTAYALQWADPTFASGQPAFDARVGPAVSFLPVVATGNDAIYMPDVAPGEHRHLISSTMWHNQNGGFNGATSLVIYDLLGYYPLIDGDSTDPQPFGNALTLPRYSTGDGVFVVVVNHIAPAVQNGLALVDYVDHRGIARSATINVPANGQNLVCSGSGPVMQADVGPLVASLPPAGVRRITQWQYVTPPGGLHCAYLVRPIANMVLGANALCAEKDFYIHSAMRCPRVFDGACLGWMSRIGAGTARSVNWYGHMTFAWG